MAMEEARMAQMLPNPEAVEPRRLAGFGSPPEEPAQDTWAVVPYFGVDIRVLDDGDVLLIDLEAFISEASNISQDDMAALGLIHSFLKRMIHPDDFRKFWDLVRLHRQDMDAQMSFAKFIIEEMSGHPTPLLSGSSAGQQGTEHSSVGDLSSRAQARLEEQGRPDLASVVLYARERQSTA
jgi:hypothetical protein